MPVVVKTPEVIESLRRIVEHIARDNLAAAVRWLNDVEAACNLLAAQPGIGQRMKTNRFGEVRRHVVGNYLVYYRPIAGGVEVLLVVHGARDQERLI